MFGTNRNKALDDQRRLEQAHDTAQEALDTYWFEKYGTDPRYFKKSMYIADTNGDAILCNEAQDVFNDNYNP